MTPSRSSQPPPQPVRYAEDDEEAAEYIALWRSYNSQPPWQYPGGRGE